MKSSLNIVEKKGIGLDTKNEIVKTVENKAFLETLKSERVLLLLIAILFCQDGIFVMLIFLCIMLLIYYILLFIWKIWMWKV